MEFDSLLNESFLMKKSGSLDSPKHKVISYFSLSPKENSLPTHVLLNILWAFSQSKKLKAFIEYNGPIEAPITKDQELGKLKVLFNNDLINTYPVYALNDVKKVNLFSRIIKSINYLIWGDV